MLSRSHPRAHRLITITSGVGVLAFIWMVEVANLGAQIAHPEIRPGSQPQTCDPPSAIEESVRPNR
jgi:hypothetical protein